MPIKGDSRTNVTQKFGMDVETFILAPVNTVRNLGVIFDSEVRFKKQIDTVVKNCIFRICNIHAISEYLDCNCCMY